MYSDGGARGIRSRITPNRSSLIFLGRYMRMGTKYRKGFHAMEAVDKILFE